MTRASRLICFSSTQCLKSYDFAYVEIRLAPDQPSYHRTPCSGILRTICFYPTFLPLFLWRGKKVGILLLREDSPLPSSFFASALVMPFQLPCAQPAKQASPLLCLLRCKLCLPCCFAGLAWPLCLVAHARLSGSMELGCLAGYPSTLLWSTSLFITQTNFYLSPAWFVLLAAIRSSAYLLRLFLSRTFETPHLFF